MGKIETAKRFNLNFKRFNTTGCVANIQSNAALLS